MVSSSSPGRYHAVHLIENESRAVVWRVLTDYFSRYVPLQAHALELGAGYCYWINAVPATHKVAVDVWDELPHYAAPGVQPVMHDLRNGLAILGNQQFDVVLASNLLEHFDADVTSFLVAEVFAHLRSGGRFIIMQPNFRYAYRHYFDDYTHRSIFTDVSLATLLRSHGFELDTVQPKFMPYSLRNTRLTVHPMLIRAYLYSPFKPWAGQMLIVGRKP